MPPARWLARPSDDPRLELEFLTGPVEGLAVSTWDGRQVLATVSQSHDFDCIRSTVHDCHQGMLRVWEAGTGRLLRTFPEVEGDLVAMRGSTMVVANWTSPLTVCDLDLDEIRRIPQADAVMDLWLTASGCAVTTDMSGGLRRYDVATGSFLGGLPDPVEVSLLEHEGRTLALLCGPEDARVVDLDTDEPVLPPVRIGLARATVLTVLSGRLTAVQYGWEGEIQILDLESGRLRGRPIPDVARLIWRSPIVRDGVLALAGERGVELWDLDNQLDLGRLAPSSAFGALAFADGRLWVAGKGRFAEGLLGRYRIERAQRLPRHRGAIKSAAFAGPHLVTGGVDGHLRVWDGQRALPVTGPQGRVAALSCVEVGDRFVAIAGCGYVNERIDALIYFFDLRTGDQWREPVHAAHNGQTEVVRATAVDGRQVFLTGGNDGRVVMWDLLTGEQLAVEHSRRYHPEGLAVGTIGGEPVAVIGGWLGDPVVLWRLSTRDSEPLPWAKDPVLAVVEVEGRAALLSRPHGELSLHDLVTGEELSRVGIGPHWITATAGHGAWIALARADGLVARYRVGAKGIEPHDELLFRVPPGALAFTPDGTLAVCADEDIVLVPPSSR